jgi:hypothetical protein
MVSAPTPKSNVYVLSPLLSTFISSGILVIDGFSFHSPMNGFSAAHVVPTAMLANTINFTAHFSMEPPCIPSGMRRRPSAKPEPSARSHHSPRPQTCQRKAGNQAHRDPTP